MVSAIRAISIQDTARAYQRNSGVRGEFLFRGSFCPKNVGERGEEGPISLKFRFINFFLMPLFIQKNVRNFSSSLFCKFGGLLKLGAQGKLPPLKGPGYSYLNK
jgi:hypothetical protein